MAGSCEYFCINDLGINLCHSNTKPQINNKTQKPQIMWLSWRHKPILAMRAVRFRISRSFSVNSEFEVSLGYRQYTEPWPACACVF